MRFSTSAKTLKSALRTAKSVVEKRSSMPILACVRIEVAGKCVTVAASDLETGLTLNLDETVTSNNGVAVVPLKALEAAIKPLKAEVILETDKKNLKIGDGQYSVSLSTNPASEYPTLPELTDSGETLPLEGLRHAIGTVAHAASLDETRYNLNGIAINADSGHCVATDGHRLAVADAGPVTLPWKGIQILPLKPVKLLCKLLKGSQDRACVTFDGKVMTFQGEGFSIGIRCIEGEFPNYKQVIPKRFVETIKVDRDALLDGIARVEHCSAERSRAVKITLDDGIGLETSNPDLGSASAHLDATRGRGEADTIKILTLNCRYLSDALKALDVGEVSIGIVGSEMVGNLPNYNLSPIKLHGGEAFPFCIIMPIRTPAGR